jgi:hypothetical protein
MRIKRDKDVYFDSITDKDEKLRYEYGEFINSQCRRARRAMTKIINDENCYISLKWLGEIDNSNFRLLHHKSYPDNAGEMHVGGIQLSVEQGYHPRNLFEIIMKRFRNYNPDHGGTYNFGVISNFVQCDQRFDLHFESFNRKIKSTIVIPITINASLIGFFCFNSYKIGALRKKHMHFLAGYCDNIANLARCITILSDAK